MRIAILLVSAIFLTGCTAVYSPVPVGESPAAISASDWNGTWLHQDGCVTIHVVDEEKGMLEIGWIEEEDGKLKLEAFSVVMMKLGDWLLGNVKTDDDPALYLWVRVVNDENQVIIWTPNVTGFKELIEKGVLPGRIEEDGNVILGELTAEHLELISTQNKDLLLELEKPGFLRRLAE